MPTIVVTDNAVSGIKSVQHVKKVLTVSGCPADISSASLVDAIVIHLTEEERSQIRANLVGESVQAWRIMVLEYIKESILPKYLPTVQPEYQVTVLIHCDSFSFPYIKELTRTNVLIVTDDVPKAEIWGQLHFPNYEKIMVPGGREFTGEEDNTVCIIKADLNQASSLGGNYLSDESRARWYRSVVCHEKGIISQNFSLLREPRFSMLAVLVGGKEFTQTL